MTAFLGWKPGQRRVRLSGFGQVATGICGQRSVVSAFTRWWWKRVCAPQTNGFERNKKFMLRGTTGDGGWFTGLRSFRQTISHCEP